MLTLSLSLSLSLSNTPISSPQTPPPPNPTPPPPPNPTPPKKHEDDSQLQPPIVVILSICIQLIPLELLRRGDVARERLVHVIRARIVAVLGALYEGLVCGGGVGLLGFRVGRRCVVGVGGGEVGQGRGWRGGEGALM